MEINILRHKIRGVYCLTADPHDGLSYEDMAAGACRGGASVLQFRAKGMTDRGIFEMGKKLLNITRENAALFILDDRIDIALALGADGVHLGQDDLPLAEARKVVFSCRGKEDFLIGYSTHSARQALEASAAGAGYVSIGPIYPTPTKPLNPLGTGIISEIRKKVKIPLVAIGGIDKSNIAAVLKAGADAAAVIRAGCGAMNVKEAVEMLKEEAGNSYAAKI